MQLIGRIIYWSFTIVALLLAASAALEFSAAENAKGNAMMRAILFFIAAVALWSFGRAILRAFAGK
jgi:hypothetical protein